MGVWAVTFLLGILYVCFARTGATTAVVFQEHHALHPLLEHMNANVTARYTILIVVADLGCVDHYGYFAPISK